MFWRQGRGRVGRWDKVGWRGGDGGRKRVKERERDRESKREKMALESVFWFLGLFFCRKVCL